MSGKICPKCKEFKSSENFFKSAKRKDGLRYQCKACSVLARKIWAAQNKNKIREYDCSYYLKNSEVLRAKSRAWAAENLERKRNSDRKYRVENSDRLKTYRSCWVAANAERKRSATIRWTAANYDRVRQLRKDLYWSNPEVFRKASRDFKKANRARYNALNSARKATKAKATPRWLSVEQKAEIQFTYDLAFAATLASGFPHQVDHYVPLRSPIVCGLHVPWNLRAVPADLNMSKGNRLPEDLTGWRNAIGTKVFD